MQVTEPNVRQGRYVLKQSHGETVRAFVPPPLPPNPPVDLAPFQILLEQANQAIGRLDGLASFLPELVQPQCRDQHGVYGPVSLRLRSLWICGGTN